MDSTEATRSQQPTLKAPVFRKPLQSPDVDAARTQASLIGLALDVDVETSRFQSGYILVDGNFLVFGMCHRRNDRMRAGQLLPRRQFHTVLVHRFGGIG